MEYAYKRHGISSFKLPITPLPFTDIQTNKPINVDEDNDPRSIQLPVTPMRINAIINKDVLCAEHNNTLRSHTRSPVQSSDESALKKTKALVATISQMSTPSTKRKISWSAAVSTPPTNPAIVHTSTPAGNLVQFRFSYKPSRDCKSDPLINAEYKLLATTMLSIICDDLDEDAVIVPWKEH